MKAGLDGTDVSFDLLAYGNGVAVGGGNRFGQPRVKAIPGPYVVSVQAIGELDHHDGALRHHVRRA